MRRKRVKKNRREEEGKEGIKEVRSERERAGREEIWDVYSIYEDLEGDVPRRLGCHLSCFPYTLPSGHGGYKGIN